MARFYGLARLVIDLLVLHGRRDRSKDARSSCLRDQLGVLRRQVARARFEPADRALLAAFARVLGRGRWSIFLVRPETILQWYRRLVAGHWTCPPHLPPPTRLAHLRPHRPGRPSTLVVTRRTIIRFARENPTWGYRRIHGELALSASRSRRRPCERSSRPPGSIPRQDGHGNHGLRSCAAKRRGSWRVTSSPSTPSRFAATTSCSSSNSTPAASTSLASPRTRPARGPPKRAQVHDAIPADNPVSDPGRRRPVRRRVRRCLPK
jgi:hypothetical protein